MREEFDVQVSLSWLPLLNAHAHAISPFVRTTQHISLGILGTVKRPWRIFFSFRYSIFFHFKLHNNFDFLDGLWDVLTNANVYETTKKLYDQDIKDSAEISDNLCHNLVKKLVIEARGVKSNLGFWHMSSNIDQLASGDDITCLALPIIKANIFLK